MHDDDMGPRCGLLLQEIRCDWPAGHDTDGVHHADVALPPAVNQMLAETMNRMEYAEHRFRVARRWQMITMAAWAASMGGFVVQLLW